MRQHTLILAVSLLAAASFPFPARGQSAKLDYEAERLLQHAEFLLEQQALSDAAQVLSVLFHTEETFVSGESDRVTAQAAWRAEQLVRKLDVDTQQALAAHWAEQAEAMLKSAIRRKDMAALLRIARHYRVTPAGRTACDRLAADHFVQGRTAEAAAVWRQLRMRFPNQPWPVARELQYAAALLDCGLEKEAAAVLARVRRQQRQQPIRVGDKQLRLPEDGDDIGWLAEAFDIPHDYRAASWLMPGGGPHRNAQRDAATPVARYRWRVPVSNDKPKVERFVEGLKDDLHERQLVAVPTLHPLAVQLDLREASRLSKGAIRNWKKFTDALKTKSNQRRPSPARHIWSLFRDGLREKLKNVPQGEIPSQKLQQQIVDELNELFTRDDFYDATAWAGLERRRSEAMERLEHGWKNLSDDERFRVNRLLLEAAFWPDVVHSYSDVVLTRTFNNLIAIDFASGKRVWEVSIDDNDPLEEVVISSKGDSLPSHLATALTHRVWNDRTFGTLASDGRRVFAMEDLELPGVPRGRERLAFPGLRRIPPATKVNRLVAYNVRTGKLEWEKGGEPGKNALELAGNFFLGPPLVMGGQLFVLGEREDIARLWALDAATGEVAWSVDIETVPVPGDVLRRNLGLNPTYAEGLLLCPTAHKQIVAVDISTREVRWRFGYPKFDPSPLHVKLDEIGPAHRTRGPWSDSLIRTEQGRAIAGPTDSRLLVCLDVHDGSLLWHAPQGSGCYVAGIRDGNVIVVGDADVLARDLQTGEIVWQSRHFRQDGLVSGQGVFHQGRLWLPLSNSALLACDLKTGRVEAYSSVKLRVPLGNLISFRDSIISQGSDFVVRLEPIKHMLTEVETRLRKDPRDTQALFEKAQLLRQQRKLSAAAEALRTAVSLDDDSAVKLQLVECLLHTLAERELPQEKLTQEIEQVINELPAETQHVHFTRYIRLVANKLKAAGRREEALKMYLRLTPIPKPPGTKDR